MGCLKGTMWPQLQLDQKKIYCARKYDYSKRSFEITTNSLKFFKRTYLTVIFLEVLLYFSDKLILLESSVKVSVCKVRMKIAFLVLPGRTLLTTKKCSE